MLWNTGRFPIRGDALQPHQSFFFFNLSGDPQKDVLDTSLTIHASHVTEVTDDLIPTGKLLPVAGGPLDFTLGKKLGADMFSEDHLIALCGGFDHNFCVDGTGFRKFASLGTGERTRNGSVFRSPRRAALLRLTVQAV